MTRLTSNSLIPGLAPARIVPSLVPVRIAKLKVSIVRSLMLVLIVSTLFGCRSALVREVNALYPPVSPAERQTVAVQTAARSLAGLERVDAYVGIGTAHLAEQLPRLIKRAEPRVDSVRLRTGKQELTAEVVFSGDFPEARAFLAGTATVHVTFAVEGQTLIVQPSASSVRLKRAKLQSGVSLDAALPIINGALSTFLNNLNGTMAAQRYPLNLSVVKSFTPASFFADIPEVVKTEGSDVDFGLYLVDSALLVDETGVHVVAQVEPASEGWPAAESTPPPINCATGEPGLPEIGCDSNCDIFDFACHARKADCEIRKVAQLASARAARDAWREACSGNLIASADGETAGFSGEFVVLAAGFRRAAVAELGDGVDAVWSQSAALISKSSVANTINRTVGDTGLCVEYATGPRREAFNQILKTEPSPDLRCTQNLRDCSPTQDCSPTRDCSPVGDCNPHWNCPDCGVLDVFCHAEKAGCELDKQRYRTQCEIEKTGRKTDCERLKAMEKLACEAEKEGKRLDCERLKAMEIAGCQFNQAWLDLWGEYEVGRVEGHATLSPVARACILGIRVSQDLAEVDVTAKVSASSPVAAEVKFTPYDLANVLCLGQWQGVLAAVAHVPEQETTIHADIRAEKGEGGLTLGLSSSPMTFQGELTPPPLAALTGQNPTFRITCAPAVGAARIAGWIDSANDPFKQKRFEIEVPAQTFSITIEPLRIEAEALSLVLTPAMTEESLVFRLR